MTDGEADSDRVSIFFAAHLSKLDPTRTGLVAILTANDAIIRLAVRHLADIRNESWHGAEECRFLVYLCKSIDDALL